MKAQRLLALGVPLNVNTATAAELGLVPGVSPSLARRIVAQRKRLGGFTRLEELRGVKGVGPVRLARWRAYLAVGREAAGEHGDRRS
jgi:competence protein ComEA